MRNVGCRVEKIAIIGRDFVSIIAGARSDYLDKLTLKVTISILPNKLANFLSLEFLKL